MWLRKAFYLCNDYVSCEFHSDLDLKDIAIGNVQASGNKDKPVSETKQQKRERILQAIYKAQTKPSSHQNSARDKLKANLRQNLVEKQARKTHNVF